MKKEDTNGFVREEYEKAYNELISWLDENKPDVHSEYMAHVYSTMLGTQDNSSDEDKLVTLADLREALFECQALGYEVRNYYLWGWVEYHMNGSEISMGLDKKAAHAIKQLHKIDWSVGGIASFSGIPSVLYGAKVYVTAELCNEVLG